MLGKSTNLAIAGVAAIATIASAVIAYLSWDSDRRTAQQTLALNIVNIMEDKELDTGARLQKLYRVRDATNGGDEFLSEQIEQTEIELQKEKEAAEQHRLKSEAEERARRAAEEKKAAEEEAKKLAAEEEMRRAKEDARRAEERRRQAEIAAAEARLERQKMYDKALQDAFPGKDLFELKRQGVQIP